MTQGNQTPSDLPRAIGNPAQRALVSAGYTHLERLTRVTEREIGQLHGVGPKAIRELREALAARDLSFAEDNRSRDA